MGASFGHENVDSLDMSWLSLPRFESQAVGVAVCGLGARGTRTCIDYLGGLYTARANKFLYRPGGKKKRRRIYSPAVACGQSGRAAAAACCACIAAALLLVLC
jgi:hypothetical protein